MSANTPTTVNTVVPFAVIVWPIAGWSPKYFRAALCDRRIDALLASAASRSPATMGRSNTWK